MPSGRACAARHRGHRLAALCDRGHTIARIVTRERPPRVVSGRARPVAPVEALGVVVRLGPHGSAGHASQAPHPSRSWARHAAACGSGAAEGARHTAQALAARWRSGAIQSAWRRGCACGWRSCGSLARPLAVFWTPHRGQRVWPDPWRSACPTPRAPSPMAQAGPCSSPRLWRSTSRACQDGARSQAPSPRPTRSWWPRASAPRMTRRPCRAASRRVAQATPSTQHEPSRVPVRLRPCPGGRASCQPWCSRRSGAGERPGASGPTRACHASEPSPVEPPGRSSQGRRASRRGDRRLDGGRSAACTRLPRPRRSRPRGTVTRPAPLPVCPARSGRAPCRTTA
jgi:hypothetical protein